MATMAKVAAPQWMQQWQWTPKMTKLWASMLLGAKLSERMLMWMML
jgi:hypothetical protein